MFLCALKIYVNNTSTEAHFAEVCHGNSQNYITRGYFQTDDKFRFGWQPLSTLQFAHKTKQIVQIVQIFF